MSHLGQLRLPSLVCCVGIIGCLVVSSARASIYWRGGVPSSPSLPLLPVSHLPDLGFPAYFEAAPPDDTGQGGFFDPPVLLETPAYLVYDPPKALLFRNASMPGAPEREMLGWWTGLDPPEILDPDYTFPPLESDALSEVVILFNTVFDVSAHHFGFGMESVFVEITDRGTGDPLCDIDGLGDGTTPLTRRYSPLNDYSAEYYYYQWTCLQADIGLPDGTPFAKWILTYADGGSVEFADPEDPGRVCLRIEAFRAAEAAYGEFARGDLTCDGRVDGFDIDAFVLAFDEDEYYAAHPDCYHILADIDCDGIITGFDIDLFIVCIVDMECPPCP